MTDPAPTDLAYLKTSVDFLFDQGLRHEQALLALAEDESLPSVTRVRVAAALAGEPS